MLRNGKGVTVQNNSQIGKAASITARRGPKMVNQAIKTGCKEVGHILRAIPMPHAAERRLEGHVRIREREGYHSNQGRLLGG